MRRFFTTRGGRAYRTGRRLTPAPGRRWRLVAGLTLIVALAYLAFWVVIPSRWVTVAPGPAPDVATLVSPLPAATGVDAGPGSGSEAISAAGWGETAGGRFLLTTVQASPATPAELWKAIVRKDAGLFPRSYLVPQGMGDETYGRWSLAAMAESQLSAAWQAFTYLGRAADLTADGGTVYWVAADSPAKDRLKKGDLVVSWTLGGRRGAFVAAGQFERDIAGAYGTLSGATEAQDLVLDVRRNEAPLTVNVPIRPSDLTRWPFIGLALGAENPRTSPPVPVSFSPGDIGGPSGGLMLALQIVDDFTPGDLTGGHVVAGSGTIGPGGEVGPVGGIGLKLRGAVSAGATVFLVPERDYEDARSAAKALRPSIDLVRVSSLAGACEALSEMAGTLERPSSATVTKLQPAPPAPGPGVATLCRAKAVSLTAPKTPDYNGAGLGGSAVQVEARPSGRQQVGP